MMAEFFFIAHEKGFKLRPNWLILLLYKCTCFDHSPLYRYRLLAPCTEHRHIKSLLGLDAKGTKVCNLMINEQLYYTNRLGKRENYLFGNKRGNIGSDMT